MQKDLMDKNDIQQEFEEYKKFAFKGDMIKLAVAFVLGGAFNKVVGSISSNIIMPLLNFVVSKAGGNWREAVWSPFDGLNFEVGQFASTMVDFFLVTIVLFILWRIMVGHVGEEESKPLLTRIKMFVLGDWFLPFAACLSVLLAIFSHNWTTGVWTFTLLSLATFWFQNRELRKKNEGNKPQV